MQVNIAVSASHLPAPRSRAIGLLLGSSVLVCGGLTSSGATTGSILRLDLATSRVSTIGVLAAPVHDAGGAVLNGVGFVIGGGRFGPESGVQRVGPTGSSSVVGDLPAIRTDLAAVSVDGELVIVGGGTPAHQDKQVLASTDGVHFRLLTQLLIAVRYPAVAVVGGVVYVVGGSTPSGDSPAIQVVDPQTGLVRMAGHLVHGLSHASAVVIGGALLVAGGRLAGRPQVAVWQIDVPTGTSRQIGRLPYAVSDSTVVVADGIGYLIGGEALGALASIISIAPR